MYIISVVYWPTVPQQGFRGVVVLDDEGTIWERSWSAGKGVEWCRTELPPLPGIWQAKDRED
jgi:hypothetical protein